LPATYFEPQLVSYEPLRQGRALGQGGLAEEQLVDLSHPDTHHELNTALAGFLAGLDGFDRGVMMTQDRRITRRVAAYLHAGTNAIGISYECRFIPGTCYAI
jgi:hypothetical protein